MKYLFLLSFLIGLGFLGQEQFSQSANSLIALTESQNIPTEGQFMASSLNTSITIGKIGNVIISIIRLPLLGLVGMLGVYSMWNWKQLNPRRKAS